MKRGNRANIIAKVKNIGKENAFLFKIIFYVSKKSNKSIDEGNTVIGEKICSGLLKDEIKTVIYKWKVPKKLGKGTYYIKAVWDSENSVTESDEGNNIGVSGKVRIN